MAKFEELTIRGALQRYLMACRENLAEQWQGELGQRSRLPFELMTNDRPIDEPVMSTGWLDYGKVNRGDGSWEYWYAHEHLGLPCRRDGGTLVFRSHGVPWPFDQSAREWDNLCLAATVRGREHMLAYLAAIPGQRLSKLTPGSGKLRTGE